MTIETLKAEFTTPAWADIGQPDSGLYKLLSSAHFKDEKKGHTVEQIDADFLRVFGLLHCGGKPRDKAICLYGILQEGGLERHEFISAQDKDIEPIFEKMCAFATWDLFTAASQIGGIEQIYDSGDCAALQEQVEALREDHFLEEVFGVQSRLENEPWLATVAGKTNWCFNTVQLRKKLFDLASI